MDAGVIRPRAGVGTPISTSRELREVLLSRRLVGPPLKVGALAQLGRFEVVHELGVGGMGMVLLARDPEGAGAGDSLSASPYVALKILRPELLGHEGAVQRFMAEAHHMRRLDHPHILRVLEVGPFPHQPFFVMPHLQRGNLAQWVRAQGPLTEAQVLRLALEIASALRHAHGRGIVHRDLKPANVLVSDRGGAVLTDFGLARGLGSEGEAGARVDFPEGTAPYMSPAVARGEAEDTRCDIYSFGAVLYEMLTGRPPYGGSCSEEITRRVLEAPPPPILRVNPRGSTPLVRVTEGAMAREWQHRYTHIIDVAADLERIEAGLEPLGPKGGRSLSWRGRARVSVAGAERGVRRGRLVPRAVVGVMLLIAVGVLVRGLWGSAPGRTVGSVPFGVGVGVEPAWFLVEAGHLLLLRAEGRGEGGAALRVVHRFPLPIVAADRIRVDAVAVVEPGAPGAALVRVAPSAEARYSLLGCFDVTAGQVRWLVEDAAGFGAPLVADLNGDGLSEVLVATEPSLGGVVWARLLNGRGEELWARNLPGRPVSWVSRSLGGELGWELLVGEAGERVELAAPLPLVGRR